MAEADRVRAAGDDAFARWLAQTPFGKEGVRALGLRPLPQERLRRLYGRELERLAKGEPAGFGEVFGDLLLEAGCDWKARRRELEPFERHFAALSRQYLERGVARAWEAVLEGRFEEGVPVLLRAARAGSGLALFYASRLFRHGAGVAKDEARAMEALESAADAGCARALVELGLALMDGRWGSADPARGRRLLEQAVALEDAATLADLGRALTQGLLGAGSLKKGAAFLQRASRAGSGQASYDLGLLAAQGLVEDAAATPLERLQLSARQGHVKAMHDLGMLFLRLARTGEEGCDLSAQECLAVAARWLAEAARRGDAEAAGLVEKLTLRLSDGSVARLADACR
ncbi:MAG: sel1 repeat family protein [Desulfovibrio sp.]|nr:sel1 repeat family protein [Desulfovibrio sp.]